MGLRDVCRRTATGVHRTSEQFIADVLRVPFLVNICAHVYICICIYICIYIYIYM